MSSTPMHSALSHRSSWRARAVPTFAEIAEYVTYWTTLLSIYLGVGFLYYYQGYNKLVTTHGTMPAPVVQAFHGSVVASFPGDTIDWAGLGVIEGLIVVLLAISLLRGEFLPHRRKPVLLTGLAFSLLHCSLGIINNGMISASAVVTQLFIFLGITLVAMIVVRQVAPYRPMSWLAGQKDADSSS